MHRGAARRELLLKSRKDLRVDPDRRGGSGWECPHPWDEVSQGPALQAELGAGHGVLQEAQASQWWSALGSCPRNPTWRKSRWGQAQGQRQSCRLRLKFIQETQTQTENLQGVHKIHTEPGSMHDVGPEAVDKARLRQWLTSLLLALSKCFI